MTETLDLMVEGGKATPNATIAQKLGPMGINIAQVMSRVNEKTASFKGMQVPVKLKLDTKAKEVTDIEVGTPPTTELIKKELGLEKGSGQPNREKVGNMAIEQCIKIATMKRDAMFSNSLKTAVKTVIGSCGSLGVLVEGKEAREIEKEVNSGKYDKEINEAKTEITQEKKKELLIQLEEKKKELAKELEKLKAAAAALAPEAKPAETAAPEVKAEVKEEKKETKEKEKKK